MAGRPAAGPRCPWRRTGALLLMSLARIRRGPRRRSRRSRHGRPADRARAGLELRRGRRQRPARGAARSPPVLRSRSGAIGEASMGLGHHHRGPRGRVGGGHGQVAPATWITGHWSAPSSSPERRSQRSWRPAGPRAGGAEEGAELLGQELRRARGVGGRCRGGRGWRTRRTPTAPGPASRPAAGARSARSRSSRASPEPMVAVAQVAEHRLVHGDGERLDRDGVLPSGSQSIPPPGPAGTRGVGRDWQLPRHQRAGRREGPR